MKLLDRLPFRPKPTARGVAETVKAVTEQANSGKAVASKAPAAMDAALAALGRSRASPVAPALLLATGAGVAFWWWTQWARGRAESEAAAKDETDAKT